MPSITTNRKRMAECRAFSDKLEVIEETVGCIFNRETPRNSFQRIHHATFQLCHSHFGNLVLEHLELLFKGQISTVKKRIIASTNFFQEFMKEWQDYDESLRQITEILLYFNKNYMGTNHHLTIQQVGERIFCVNTFSDSTVSELLLNSIKSSVGNVECTELLQEFGQTLLAVENGKFFDCFFGKPYIEVTTEAYVKLSTQQKASLGIIKYLQWVQSVVAIEVREIECSFFFMSEDKVKSALYSALVFMDKNTVDGILTGDSGLSQMISSWDFKSVESVVQVFSAVGRQREVAGAVAHLIEEQAKSIIRSRGSNVFPFPAVSSMVQLVSNTKQLDTIFPSIDGQGLSLFLRAIRNVVSTSSRFMDTLSLYFDHTIRREKGEVVETMCNKVITILQLTPELDAFESAFRVHLAARLIHAEPHAVDTECLFIEQLNSIYGSSAVNSFQKMIEDIQSAAGAQQRFVLDMNARKVALPLNFNALILTSRFWPHYTNVPLKVPPSMETCRNIFEEYYRRRHNGRKLVFQMGLGSVVFDLLHDKKVYCVSAQTQFVNAIEALNANGSISIADVAAYSLMSTEEVSAQFNTLCRVGLAQVEEATYRFNESFFSAKADVKVSISTQKSYSDGKDNPPSRTTTESMRSMSIDATIVKLLKKSKSIDHDDLYRQVTDRLRPIFMPSTGSIKQRIEVLVEKGFLARGENTNCYFYCT